VQQLNLTNGRVLPNIDTLIVIAPQFLNELQRFAIDQYLMSGGSVILLAGNYHMATGSLETFTTVQPVTNGLRDLLGHYGIDVGLEMVLDTQSQPVLVRVPENRDLNRTVVSTGTGQ